MEIIFYIKILFELNFDLQTHKIEPLKVKLPVMKVRLAR